MDNKAEQDGDYGKYDAKGKLGGYRSD